MRKKHLPDVARSHLPSSDLSGEQCDTGSAHPPPKESPEALRAESCTLEKAGVPLLLHPEFPALVLEHLILTGRIAPPAGDGSQKPPVGTRHRPTGNPFRRFSSATQQWLYKRFGAGRKVSTAVIMRNWERYLDRVHYEGIAMLIRQRRTRWVVEVVTRDPAMDGRRCWGCGRERILSDQRSRSFPPLVPVDPPEDEVIAEVARNVGRSKARVAAAMKRAEQERENGSGDNLPPYVHADLSEHAPFGSFRVQVPKGQRLEHQGEITTAERNRRILIDYILLTRQFLGEAEPTCSTPEAYRRLATRYHLGYNTVRNIVRKIVADGGRGRNSEDKGTPAAD